MKYLRKSFSVPTAPACSQDDWDAIFGTEEERKKKLADAIAVQKEGPRKAGRPQKCGGGAGCGKVSSALPEDVYKGLEDQCKAHGIDTATARRQLEQHAHEAQGTQREAMERAVVEGGPRYKEQDLT